MHYNGPRVWAESGGGAVPPTTCPGALAEKLSRRARHHGAVFANPGANFEKLMSLAPILVPVDERETIANTVTSFLPIPASWLQCFYMAEKQSWFTIIRFAEASDYILYLNPGMH
jgi:hypothetical protein